MCSLLGVLQSLGAVRNSLQLPCQAHRLSIGVQQWQSIHAAVVIHCDNISSIMLANNPVYHARTKHIEVHYHFVREKVLAGEIDLVYVSTEEQVADIFTKALGTEKLRRFRSLLGVLEMDLSLRGSVEISSSSPDISPG